MAKHRCPRCKQYALDRADCGESGLYGSQHLVCNPCWDDEEREIEARGTNDLPETLAAYGPPNDLPNDLPNHL